jgi:CHASE2 domain-containing sensor protein
MSRHLTSALVAGVTFGLSAAAAPAEAPSLVEVGAGLPIVNGGFTPKALPKGKPAHIAMDISLHRPDDTPSPALHEVVLELDRNITVDAKGMAICPSGTVESPPPPQRCQSASIGRGEIEVEVAFPEEVPFIVKSKLLAFNAGGSGGKGTIRTYAYLGSPLSAAIVINVEISKIHNGRYGTKWVETIPKIAGGYGSIKSLNLLIDRRYRDEGEMTSYLLGRCPDGHLDARATSVFANASERTDSFVRSCSPTPPR